MRALVLEDGALRLDEARARPHVQAEPTAPVTARPARRSVPSAGDALIRVSTAGICGTDLALLGGYAGGFSGVLGHEMAGVVTGGGDPAWRGRRVTASINVGCGACPRCASEGPEHCRRRVVVGIRDRDGCFADYVAVPPENLHALPDAVTDRQAVFAEPLAAALRIREQVRVRPSARAAIVGPGRLGMLAAAVLALSGTRTTVIGRRPESLALARRWGLEAAVSDEADGDCFDLVVDATGEPAGLAVAMRIVRARGTVVLKSTYAEHAPAGHARAGGAGADPAAGLAGCLTGAVVREVRLVGSRCGPIEPALALLARGAGAIDVDSLVDGEYALEDAARAFAHAARPGARKIVFRIAD